MTLARTYTKKWYLMRACFCFAQRKKRIFARFVAKSSWIWMHWRCHHFNLVINLMDAEKQQQQQRRDDEKEQSETFHIYVSILSLESRAIKLLKAKLKKRKTKSTNKINNKKEKSTRKTEAPKVVENVRWRGRERETVGDSQRSVCINNERK